MSWQEFETYHFKSDRKRSWGYTSSSRQFNGNERYQSPPSGDRPSKKWKNNYEQSSDPRKRQGEYKTNYNGNYGNEEFDYDSRDGCSNDNRDGYESSSSKRHRPNRRHGKRPSPEFYDQKRNGDLYEEWKDDSAERHIKISTNKWEKRRYSAEISDDDNARRKVSLVSDDEFKDPFSMQDYNRKKDSHSPVQYVSSVKTIANKKYHKNEKGCEIIHKSSIQEVMSITRKSKPKPSELTGRAIPTITNYTVSKTKNQSTYNHTMGTSGAPSKPREQSNHILSPTEAFGPQPISSLESGPSSAIPAIGNFPLSNSTYKPPLSNINNIPPDNLWPPTSSEIQPQFVPPPEPPCLDEPLPVPPPDMSALKNDPSTSTVSKPSTMKKIQPNKHNETPHKQLKDDCVTVAKVTHLLLHELNHGFQKPVLSAMEKVMHKIVLRYSHLNAKNP